LELLMLLMPLPPQRHLLLLLLQSASTGITSLDSEQMDTLPRSTCYLLILLSLLSPPP